MDAPSQTPATAFLAAVAGIRVEREPSALKRKSRDFYWYSPVLKAQLDSRTADAIVQPRDTAEVIQVAAAAHAARLPLTARGGGTGNYGQAVPLQGGAVVEMTALTGIVWLRDGVVRVRAGTNMLALDRALRAEGWEMRLFPSTKRTATIGGFIAGGSGGVGSITWGWLREPGNLIAAQIVTAEAAPRLLEMRGAAAGAINHAYGTSGLITELELPVQPSVRWVECAAAFPDLAEAARFGVALTLQTGIEKKLCSLCDPRLTPFFRPLDGLVPEGAASAVMMVAPAGLTALRELAAAHGGTLVLEADATDAEDSPDRPPLYELTWNHTTLQVLKRDRSVTYLQCAYPADAPLERLAHIQALLGGEMMQHLECVRFGGRATFSDLPVLRFTTAARLDSIIALHEASGVGVANPHVFTIEDGAVQKAAPPDQLAFKREADPLGLLNPGKMRSFTP